MVNIYGELIRAQIERLSADPAQGMQGRIWLNTTSLRVKIDNGTVIIPLLGNDQNIVIGTNGTAANNLRFNRAGAATLELLIGSDTTAEGTSTPANWAKLNTKLGGSLVDSYLDYAEIATPANPAATKHRLYFKADGNLYKLNNAGTEVQVDAASGTAAAYTLQGNNTSSTAGGPVNLTPPQVRAFTFFYPTKQTFASGSGTYNPSTQFAVASANATVGATYTNNSVTFTVSATIAAGTVLTAVGAGSPLTSGTLTKTSGTGDATITFYYAVTPLYSKVRIVGGGGGGAQSGTLVVTGSAGGNTTFGVMTANGGGYGNGGGVGGSASGGEFNVTGTAGYGGGGSGNSSTGIYGGVGGASFFGGGGPGGNNAPGNAAVPSTNSGSGGGGGGGSSTVQAAGGGGAGGYSEKTYTPPIAVSYAVGAGGTAGTGLANGTAGAAGLIIVEEFYQ